MVLELGRALINNLLPTVLVIVGTLIAVFIALELLAGFGITQRLEARLAGFMRSLSLPSTAALPYLLGLLFGVAVAVATLVQGDQLAKDDKTRRRLVLLLAPCHGLLEETAFLVALGGVTYIAVLARLGWHVAALVALRMPSLIRG